MLQFFWWLLIRLSCTATGHSMDPARIYYPPGKSMESGYRCSRCGKEQLMKYRWQR